MKNHKTLIAFIILFLLLAVFTAFAFSTKVLFPREASSGQKLKVSGMTAIVKRVEDQIDLVESGFRQDREKSAELMTYALGQFVTEDGYEGPDVFDNGIVLRIEKGTIVYPETGTVRFPGLKTAEDLSGMPLLAETSITEEDGNTRTILLTVKSVSKDLYYLEWTEPEDHLNYINSRANLEEAVKILEKSYSAGLLLAADQGSEFPVIYHPEEFGKMETLGDIGITGDMIASETPEIKIGETLYKADYEDLTFRGQPVKAIILSAEVNDNVYTYNCIIIAVGFILLCMSGLILWIGWVRDYIRDNTLTERQEKAYHPAKMRKTAIAVGLNGAILLLLILTGYQLMANLSRTSAGNQEMLDIIMARLENESRRDALVKDETEIRELNYAKRTAELYRKSPKLQNREFLAKATEVIGCDFIMVFDNNGKELMSSNAYVNFTLGEELSTTEDFRFLLQGVDRIIHEPEADTYTGKTIQLAGIRIDTDEEGRYEAMLLAFDLEASLGADEKQETAGYINMLTPRGYLSLVISQDNGRIVYASEPDYVGSTPKEIGLEETDLIPTSLEPFEILKRKTYGAFNENEQYRCYYIMDAEKIWGDTLLYSAAAALAYLAICLIISWFLLGHAQLDLSRQSGSVREKLHNASAQLPDKRALEQKVSVFKENFLEGEIDNIGEKSLKEWWQTLTPEKKVLRLMTLLVTIIQALVIGLLIARDKNEGGSVIGFILTGSWKHGVNDLALMSIFCVIFILAAFILIKDWLLRILCAILNPKGETIARLVSSLLQYISIITALCVCLSYLGLDTGTLITSAGIMTLAISLGSKDLVADILSGIFIIFEGDFHVGDVIEVNGFKGRVLEIGVRTTKLIDSSRNIKIIDNQSVKNILNLSRENSWCYIPLTISNNQPLEEIEAMLDRELPKIGKEFPEIISGPFYVGIETVSYRRITIAVCAECRQQDVKTATRNLNHALWALFEKNGYQL